MNSITQVLCNINPPFIFLYLWGGGALFPLFCFQIEFVDFELLNFFGGGWGEGGVTLFELCCFSIKFFNSLFLKCSFFLGGGGKLPCSHFCLVLFTYQTFKLYFLFNFNLFKFYFFWGGGAPFSLFVDF